MFELKWTEEAIHNLKYLQQQAGKKGTLKQVTKALKYLSVNPRYPGLHTHPYSGLEHPWSPKEKVFEAYAPPGAYRIMWCDGPEPDQLTIIAIIPHP